MVRKGRKIYLQERITAQVLQRCRVIKSADGQSTLYFDPVRARLIKVRPKEKPKEETKETRYYPPLVAKRISLVDTYVAWDTVRVQVKVVYDRETDEIISDIKRLDK